VKPDAWLYDSITIKSNGREVESETARVDREEHWPNERPLFSAETVEEWLLKKRDEHYDLKDSHSDAKIGLVNELIEDLDDESTEGDGQSDE